MALDGIGGDEALRIVRFMVCGPGEPEKRICAHYARGAQVKWCATLEIPLSLFVNLQLRSLFEP